MTRQEWLDWRREGVGASDVAAIVGASPYAGAYSVWANKTGLTPDQPETQAMAWGHDLEPVVLAWFTRETGMTVINRQKRCVHKRDRWARTTVDGVARRPPDRQRLGVVEAKTTGTEWGALPGHVHIQVQWQMYVTGLPYAWIPTLHGGVGGMRGTIFEVAYDPLLANELANEVRDFWLRNVAEGVPPPATAKDTPVLKHVPALHDDAVTISTDLYDAWTQAYKDLKAAREAYDSASADIRGALGTHTVGQIDGRTVLTCREESRVGTIDYRRLAEQLGVDLAPYRNPPSTSRVLRHRGRL